MGYQYTIVYKENNQEKTYDVIAITPVEAKINFKYDHPTSEILNCIKKN